MDDDADVEKQNRVLLRPWLENMLETESIPGLEWFDAEKTMFKVPWKHRSKKDWSMRHSSVFLEWAKNTGRWSEGDPPPNFAQLKTRLRCAFNKAPDIDEMKECHCSKGEEPFKVYRFNTRRGDLKSALGQKSCQKTVGSRQGRISGSPAVLKYESCEEEVVDDDDNAIYGEAEIQSLTFSSGESASGFGKFEMRKVEIGQNCLSAVSGNDPTWSYRGCAPQCESRDSKSPVIPLTVEMMTSYSPNDDSDCDGELPSNVWHDSSNRSASVSVADDVLQMTVKKEVLSENIHQIKTTEMQKPDSEDSADKMHLLQMASLFVEAAERKKEKEIQQDNMTPEQSTVSDVHMDTALSQYPSNQYMVIMPSHCEIETQNEGSVTSGYVTPTSNDVIDVKLPLEEQTSPKTSVDINFAESEVYQLEVAGVDAPELHNLKKFEETDSVQRKDEAVDLMKSSMLVKSSATPSTVHSDCHVVSKIQPLGCSGNRNIEAAKIQFSFQSGGDDFTFSTQAANDVLMPLSEQSTMDQIKRYLGKRSEQSRQQLEWENHLRSWENRLQSWESRLQSWELQLQSKEETMYWRDRCLQSELGINSTSNRAVLNYPHSKELNVCCDNSVLTLTSSKQPYRPLKDMLTVTPSTAASSLCSPVIVSAGLFNSGVNKESKQAASVSNEEMAESQLNSLNCLQGNKHFGLAHPLNQLANNLCPSKAKESSGKLDGEQLNVLKSYSACGAMSSGVQSVSVMSLMASNQGVPVIVPLIVQQHLVPLAQSLNPDTGVLIRNCLDSKSFTKRATLVNVVDGLEAKKCSLRENSRILSAHTDSDKPRHYGESNGCSQVSGLDLQVLESTEKSKEAVNLEKEQDREQKNKVPVSVLDCSSQNVHSVENSDLKHLDSESPESNKSLHTISVSRNSQKGHKSKYDTATSVGCVAPSGHRDIRSESRNCPFVSAIPAELKPDAVPKTLQKIAVSLPQVSLSVASGQTTTWACSKSTDFATWLRAKTEIICKDLKEESLEGRKNIEDNEDLSRHCSEDDDDNQCSSKSEFRIQMINQDDSNNHLQHDLNLGSTSDSNSVLVSSTALTPQVPLVVENENDFLETDSVDDSVTKSSPFSSTNLVKKRKQGFEKQNSFKKVFVDALL